MIRRLVTSVALGAVALVAIGAPASAHIDPDPEQAQAGSRLTVGFTVEHGCDGSPTVQLDMRLPEGVADAVAETADGWTGSVDTTSDGTVVSFVGGPLADDVEGTFDVTMTLPRTPDTTIFFPFVQRCEVGEIRWIGIPQQPGDELDEPAPAMALTGPVAPVPPTSAPATTAPATTDAPATTQPATTAPTTDVPTTTDATADSTTPDSTVAVVSTGDGSTGSSNTGTIAFVITMAVVLALAAFVVIRTRRSNAAAAAAAATRPDTDLGTSPGGAG